METVSYHPLPSGEYDGQIRPNARFNTRYRGSTGADPANSVSTTGSSFGSGADTRSVDSSHAADAIHDLKIRLRTAKEDSEHYRSLYRRAEVTRQQHRTDLQGLMASERERWQRRQMDLRGALQQAMEDSHGLLAKIDALRAEREAEMRQGLDEVRSAHDTRMAELESMVATLREECAHVAKFSEEALIAREEATCALERALHQQTALHDELQKVKDLVLEARTRSRAPRVSPARRRACEDLVVSAEQCCRHSPQANRRVFLPSGPVDTSPQRRAASPTSHHVLALLSTIKRQNYLRPRAYEARHYGVDLCRGTGGFSSGDGTAGWRPSSPSFSSQCVAHVGCDQVASRGPHHRRQSSPFASRLDELASAEAAEISPDPPTQLSAARTAELAQPQYHTHDVHPTPPLLPLRGRERDETPPSCAPHAPSHQAGPTATKHTPPFSASTSSSPIAATDLPWNAPRSATMPHPLPPSTAPYYGRRVNALVRALLEEVQELRRHYGHYQAQLRDPHGDSVEASQQMRTLMQLMDEKVDQVRALRAAQAQKSEELRWQETMHDIHRDNAYSEGLYRRLCEL